MKNRITLEIKYKVKALFDELSSVNDVLISYYLPLITNDGYALYSFFLSETKNNAINTLFISVDRIIDILNFSPEKIEDVISKLEFYHLLEVVSDSNGKIIIYLNKPLSAEEFNSTEQFKEILISKIGNNNFEINNKMYNSLKKNNDVGFLSTSPRTELNLNNDGVKSKKIKVYHDFDSIKSIIAARGIDWSEFWDKELENELLNLLLIFKINSFDIAVELIDEYETGNFDSIKIFNKIRSNYSKKSNIDSGIALSNELKLSYLKGLNIKEYFNTKLERDPSNSELNLIKTLKNKYGFEDFLINILIDYSIIVNDGAINKNYILKISDTVLKEGMNSPELLIKHLKVSYKMKKNKNTNIGISSKKEMEDKPIF